jgi:hypothetical protein
MLHRRDGATTMLHRRDGARFPPDMTLDIQAKEFNLGFISPENLVSQSIRGLFTVPKCRTNSRKHTLLYRDVIAWNFLPSQINSKPGFKKQMKQHLTAQHLSPS